MEGGGYRGSNFILKIEDTPLEPQLARIEGIEMRQVIGIAFAQFLGCTLWFSVNGVSVDLTDDWGLQPSDLGLLTSAVQAGFIAGTMGLAVSNLADKFKLSQIFNYLYFNR